MYSCTIVVQKSDFQLLKEFPEGQETASEGV